MRANIYQQCTRCVMDTSDPEIIFNGKGHCNHCTDFLEIRAQYSGQGKYAAAKFKRLIDDLKRSGSGKAYDCVMGISGGVDSSYLAHVAKQHGLRPLAVHMDNGWDSTEAVINIRNLTKKLVIDYESYVLDWEEFKELQLAFLKASVPEAETPTDMAIPVALHQLAAKHNVKYIISAGNIATEGILPKSWHYNARDMKYFNHILKAFGRRQLQTFQNFDYKKEFYFKFIKGIKTVYPLNFMPYVQKEAVRVLEKQFGYRYSGRKHYESIYTRFIQSYYLLEKFGIDYRRATFSSQILNGQLKRECALEKLKTRPYSDTQLSVDKEYISKKLGISGSELDRIIALPAKWYWDYPNDDTKLAYLYAAYRRLFKKEKLASV